MNIIGVDLLIYLTGWYEAGMMEIYSFDRMKSEEINAFESLRVTLSRLVYQAVDASIGVMHILPAGLVGYHQATSDQLFMAVEGSGWVAGEDRKPVMLHTSQAVYWKAGEWHASGSNTGMTAVIVEAEQIQMSALDGGRVS